MYHSLVKLVCACMSAHIKHCPDIMWSATIAHKHNDFKKVVREVSGSVVFCNSELVVVSDHAWYWNLQAIHTSTAVIYETVSRHLVIGQAIFRSVTWQKIECTDKELTINVPYFCT